MSLLTVSDLRVSYPVNPPVVAVDGISFDLAGGECLAIIGESGSGKSTIGNSVLGLVPEASRSGVARFDGMDLIVASEDTLRAIRWTRLGMVFQSTTSLNPVLTVGDQIDEPIRVHLNRSAGEARDMTERALVAIGLDPAVADRYPGELSGGQRRMAAIALALAGEPDILILDEPTAGLDPTTRNLVASLLLEFRRKGMSMILLSHDLDVVTTVADRVMVLYRGWVAELGAAEAVLSTPVHPYTVGFINSRLTLGTLKDIRGIRGDPPNPANRPVGCPFLERCTQAIAECSAATPRPSSRATNGPVHLVSCIRGGLVTLMRAAGIRKSYRVGSSGWRRRTVAALAGVDIEVREGEVVGVAGPNGAGKSTLGQVLARLIEPDTGHVEFEGADLGGLSREEMLRVRRRMQFLFQDPYEALSPRLTIGDAVREPLDIQQIGTPNERVARVKEMLARVRLPFDDGFLGRYSHQLSGGQLQRVGLARALILQPKLLVADEPLEGLDPSEQSKMLQLLKELQVDLGMALVLVSHNLAVLVRAADRIYVLDAGRIVEHSTGTNLMFQPRHQVTRSLLAASGRDLLFGSGEPFLPWRRPDAADPDLDGATDRSEG